MSVFRAIALPVVAAALVVACGSSHNNAPVPNTTTGVTNAQQRADAQVVEQLATARCRHQKTCNNIGAGKTYVSEDTCMQQMRGSTTDELNAYNCPRGISETGLRHCIAAIENEQCGNVLDSMTTSNDCRNSALCMQ